MEISKIGFFCLDQDLDIKILDLRSFIVQKDINVHDPEDRDKNDLKKTWLSMTWICVYDRSLVQYKLELVLDNAKKLGVDGSH